MEELTIAPWKADKYRVNAVERPSELLPSFRRRPANTSYVEALPGASWKRINPFDFYRPSEGGRDAEAGPHLEFLRLRTLAKEKPHLLEKGIVLFAREYGLLGIFQSIYLPEPVMRRGKLLIAPEAVLDDSGALKKVDPATEGMEQLLALRRARKLPETYLNELSEEWFRRSVALPKEVRLIAPRRFGQSRKITPWPEARREFGALLVLTPWGGVSPVCTREPLQWWEVSLDKFPAPGKMVTGDHIHLRGVRPAFSSDEDGYLNPGWVCDSLLSAMHLMLCLDLSGESTIRKCQSRGCPEYFRAGPYSRARYCSSRCASRASTRLSRGREP